jgi:riboflavin synthase
MFTGLVQHVGRIAERRETPVGASLILSVGGWPEGAGVEHPAHSPPLGDLSAASGAPPKPLQPPRHSPLHPPLELGESISVSGCCLTLAEVIGGSGAPASRAASTAASTGDSTSASGEAGVERRLRFDVIHQTLRVTALGALAVGHRVNLERSVTPATLLGGHIVQGHVDGLGRVVAIETGGGEWRLRVAIAAELHRYLHDKGSIAVDGVSLTIAALNDEHQTFDVCLIPETLARTTLGDRAVGDAVHIEVDALAKMVARLLRR